MLTRNDRTVVDCLEVLESIVPLGLKHIGFKDVGVPTKTLKALTTAIKDMGATSYLEVVSETPEACLNSARVGGELGIDCLLGGTAAVEILNILKGTRTLYYPFPGKPSGHPTKLGGTPADIEADCRKFLDAGCAGVDLLAYRATDADPLELVKAARRGLGTNRLIVAGSIASRNRIRDIAEAGADAFTIGSAVLDGSYNNTKGLLQSQISSVLADSNFA
ncbi:MAG: 4-hydroxythreonine-4-phosphate dehydrogenase [Aestuariivirga sp.]|nr:4-hydroxythreonine-4-phosphate dehydrogenase [Hyphomicrobiales bacterium]